MLPPGLAQRLERALRGLQYGSVQLVIHDAQVVRIERVECERLTVPAEAASLDEVQPTDPSEVRHEAHEEI